MSRGDLTVSRWLDAFSERNADLMVLPGNAVLADVAGDGNFQLIITDAKLDKSARSKMRVYRGTSAIDIPLPDIPNSVIAFYTDLLEPRIPAVAVACGSNLLVHKNNKLYFKFQVPLSPITPAENDIWKDVKENGPITVEKVKKFVNALAAIPQDTLSTTNQMLMLKSYDLSYGTKSDNGPKWQNKFEYNTVQVLKMALFLTNVAQASMGNGIFFSNSSSTVVLSEPKKFFRPHRPKISELIEKYGSNQQYYKETPITCMAVINKNSNETDDLSCPVIATESGSVYIVEPQNFTILHQSHTYRMKVTPFIMKATGIFNLEYRIVIACREGHICLLRKGYLEGKSIVQLINHIVDFVLVPEDNFIVVATVDKLLTCYTMRGHKLWSLEMPKPITCLCMVPLSHMTTNLVAVGLNTGVIQLFHGRKFVDQLVIPDAPSVLTFGQLGQEEHVFAVVTINGTVVFRILKRTADFQISTADNSPHFQSKPLPLPKRSKLFLEQSLREKQMALDMHQSFQQDLIRLRLNAARSLLQCSATQSNVLSQKEQIKLSAQVLGLGPKFTVIFTLENMESEKAISDIRMVLHVNPADYKCSTNLIKIPLLLPAFSFKMKIDVEEMMEDKVIGTNDPENSIIRVFIMRPSQMQPVLAAVINMPPTDFPL